MNLDPLRRSDPDFFQFDWSELLIVAREPGRTYAEDEVVRPDPPVGFYAICTTAGMTGHRPPIWPRAAALTIVDGSVVWTMVEPGAVGLPSISDVVYTITPTGIQQSNPSTTGLRTRVKLDAANAELGTYEILAEIVSGGEDHSYRATLEVID
jgi:hypothetical protein